RRVREAELVPEDDSVASRVPVRHHEMMPQQNAVESAGARDEAFTRGCGDDRRDQLVDHRVLDPNGVPAPRTVRGFRPPKLFLFVPGRPTLPPAADDNVEVEGPHAVDILRLVDEPGPGVD